MNATDVLTNRPLNVGVCGDLVPTLIFLLRRNSTNSGAIVLESAT